ncbi:MAG TPA: hypothetical protein VEK82_10345 [Stellaceae bacterium]|nr:hypothetical protein [Stellaceae bacterium]
MNLHDRRSNLFVTRIDALREAVRDVRRRASFRIDGWVVLPDHMHCLWTLPEGDLDFPGRWWAIKTAFSKSLPKTEERFGRHGPQRRARHLAEALLGAHHPGR